ncbi:c-di-AMP phosphodiesterase, consists of a GGDEF-like and DHH domains [Lachnospiraceae bacterium C7]|nr:c-di-AMP phosphodiesterase, consists of a GGDEF-like and DHH domains [Lachnospiraceae bacterium C7]
MKGKIKFKGGIQSYLITPFLVTFVLFGIDIPLYFIDKRAGALVTVCAIVYFGMTLVRYKNSKSRVMTELVDFATEFATVQKRLLDEFDVPYALLDFNGKILWVNQKFGDIAGIDKKYHKSITTIFPTITKEFLQKAEKSGEVKVDKEDRKLKITLDRIYFNQITEKSEFVDASDSAEFLTAVYVYDETELQHYKNENVEQKLVSALVYIDNYEEALESIEDVQRSLLTALIDRKVNNYFREYDALVRKIEKDKYFLVFKYKYLKKLEEDKFSVIEDVKTIKVGNEMAVTLSIGVGMRDNNYNHNYEYARAAIDLALGRGGDQVVVKEGENISYYGGKRQQVEKNTRVKARVKAHALREIMEGVNNIVIMGHSLTDIDSLGAGIGIYCAAKAIGKKAQICINSPSTSVRPLMDTFKPDYGYPDDLFIDSEAAIDATNENTMVMVVDTNKPSYVECPEILKMTNTIVVFDHHRQGKEVITNPLLSYIEPYASSACEMVAEVLQYFAEGLKLTSVEAECIYAGIIIDTNNFMTKAGVKTFEAAAYLKRSGVEVAHVRKMLRNDMEAYKARAESVRQAEVYRDVFAISICPSENLESPTVVAAQAANELLNIIGIKATFVLTAYKDKIYISARSIDEINVQLIMEKLGGGGHLNVAGAQLAEVSIIDAKKIILKTIDEMLKEGEINS